MRIGLDQAADGITIDRLPGTGTALALEFTENGTFGLDAKGPREPHRHEYHELNWARSGSGCHLIDGRSCAIRPNTLTLIGRGQVHVFERASGINGVGLRFGSELLDGSSAGRANLAWLLEGRGERTIEVPAADAQMLEGMLQALAVETRRPPDAFSVDVQRHLLSTLLLWVARWHRAAGIGQAGLEDVDVQLYARFVSVLNRDFARYHAIGHYADVLAVPPSALSAALARVTGRTTKELITDRVMLEAARLLRFTDLTVGQIAFHAGFEDQFYFSRAFKRRYGEAPLAYRARQRGAGQPLAMRSSPRVAA
jgi:AraC family transcriptional regulator, transcriptional activator of pobA